MKVEEDEDKDQAVHLCLLLHTESLLPHFSSRETQHIFLCSIGAGRRITETPITTTAFYLVMIGKPPRTEVCHEITSHQIHDHLECGASIPQRKAGRVV